MGSPSFARMMLRNILVAALLSVPAALIVFTVIVTLFGLGDDSRGGQLLLDLTIILPVLAIVGAVGGVLVTFALTVAHRHGMRITRAKAALFSPLVILPLVAFPARVFLIYPPFAAGVVVGLGVLVAAARLPEGAEGEARRTRPLT